MEAIARVMKDISASVSNSVFVFVFALVLLFPADRRIEAALEPDVVVPDDTLPVVDRSGDRRAA